MKLTAFSYVPLTPGVLPHPSAATVSVTMLHALLNIVSSPLKKCVALRLHYILRALILAEFLDCVNALAGVIVGFIGFALIRPSGTFSRVREKGVVRLVMGCFLLLARWLGLAAAVYC
ncbi:hypothetical protein VB145_14040 [Xanthomonas arboricola]|uniref:hypothetical protein n=1 Tax=Xanthomonas arboricola TaxID=56448 RepID=UPI00118760DB|nr:hypothetical protein [Xanthomonas arboricola]MEA5149522.1 hypothetical protein [Xanthomonas arboricola]UQP96333.1 hypothetical protein KP728_11740 [Xanthomonas arboricola pv. juglandis]UQQ02548.1 hypothetical protein KP727_00710 [Xanthomonas arboricola pv. juglandis]CAD7387731.1 hypothetical protein X12_004431 [Xanthomonas arboricola]